MCNPATKRQEQKCYVAPEMNILEFIMCTGDLFQSKEGDDGEIDFGELW